MASNELVALVVGRIGVEFQGEAHFSEDEARKIASAIEALEATNAEVETALERERMMTAELFERAQAAEAHRDRLEAKVARQATEIQRMARKIKNQRGMARTTWAIVEERAHWTRGILNRNKYLEMTVDAIRYRRGIEAALRRLLEWVDPYATPGCDAHIADIEAARAALDEVKQ